jgi:hypothetical protein
MSYLKFMARDQVVEALKADPWNFPEIEMFVGGDIGNFQESLVAAGKDGPLRFNLHDVFVKFKSGVISVYTEEAFVRHFTPVRED